jgi:hypothetical protein
MFAGMAKLMQGSRGRELLGFANEKGTEAKPIDIVEADVAPDAEPTDNKRSDLKATDKKAGAHLSPTELTRAMLSGEREASIGGRHFELNEGTGAKIRMPQGLKDARAMGKKGQEVLTPKFIALGHEMGHAVKSKAGAKGSSVGFDALPKGLEKSDWAFNPEEYLNVEGVENPIREEHNIGERGKYTHSVIGNRQGALLQQVSKVDEIVFRDKRCHGSLDEASTMVREFKGYEDKAAYDEFVLVVKALLAKIIEIHKTPLPEEEKKVPTDSPPKDGGSKGGFLGGLLSGLW